MRREEGEAIFKATIRVISKVSSDTAFFCTFVSVVNMNDENKTHILVDKYFKKTCPVKKGVHRGRSVRDETLTF